MFESVETQLWVTKAANSKSTGPQQQNANDRNRWVGSAVRSTCAEWQSADVDDQWRLLLAYNWIVLDGNITYYSAGLNGHSSMCYGSVVQPQTLSQTIITLTLVTLAIIILSDADKTCTVKLVNHHCLNKVITLLRYSPICTGCRCAFGSSTRLDWSHSRRWRRNSRSTWQNSSATTRFLDNCNLAAKTFYRTVHRFWTFLSVLFVMPHLQSGIVFLNLLFLI